MQETITRLPTFPPYFSILLSGPPGVGKLEWLLTFARRSVEAGEGVVFVTLDAHPKEVEDRAASIGFDMDPSADPRLAFVDCYSPAATERPGPSTTRTFVVSSYANLEGLGMAISKAAQDIRVPARVLVYTVSTLFLHNTAQTIAKFVQIMTNRVKTNLGFIAYAVHEGVHDSLTMNLLSSLVDGVIEMRFTDSMDREVRTHHLRGFAVTPAWEPLSLPGAW